MSDVSLSQSFFVKVEGKCHSNHRNPQGVYKIDVVPEKSVAHSACAALAVAREAVPFLDENPNYFTLRAFLEDGTEVIVPRPLVTAHDRFGCFQGRSKDYPESITIQ